MYAIFEDGGKQYKVNEGDVVLVDVKDVADDQQEVTFDQVLMVGAGADARIGTPFVAGASVRVRILERLQMPKVSGVKFRRRKGLYKRWGHRQPMLRVQVEAINS